MMMMLCNLQTLAFIRTYTYRTLHTTATSASLPSKSSFLNCGFSVKTHFCASNVVPLQSCSDEDRPTSVLKLFQDFGFSQSDITRINSKQPGVLTFHPDKYIKPKLEFLLSITKSESEVVRIITKNPLILKRSLNNHLMPFFGLLKSATGSDENAAAAVITNPFVLSFCLSASFMKNIEFLQEMGVPQSQILKLITKYGQAVGEQHTKFCKVVLKVKGMGLDLSSSYFIDAVRALSFLSDEAWESRCEMYRSYGFCDDDIFTMFKKHPTVMSYSEKRMRELLDFFIYKLGWSPSRLSNSPNVLQYSLHKRTVPRCSVLQALVLKQCNNRSMMLSSILAMTDSKFMEIFVTEYDDEITEVMDAYQGKLRFDEYNFEQEMKANLKG
ncbi:hypothetical protein DCAR_0519410 [Daucus carota subsp. sativus]|uniref:Uncharacterized protein n=1 Tax=Daucus carota subsp. sativus TaxID=79200 RepID=A0AAF0X4E5_DAUCS|nr:PREDICTED: transcription termination factor MTERF8, chloroplastic-like [Daucus carota subsp. sativus]WOH00054.1 hypothetical protein DCAR_0519410 [Daucus carota subsp. sativus]